MEVLTTKETIKYYTSICNSAPAEILSLISLNNKEKILKRNNQIVADNLGLLDQFLKHITTSSNGCVHKVDVLVL
jgi:hypothetical protein